MEKVIKYIIILSTLIGIAFSLHFYVDRTYAKDAKLNLVEYRLEFKIQNDVLTDTRKEYWSYVDRYGKEGEKAPDPLIKSRMQNLKQQVGDQEIKVDQLRKNIK